MSLSRHAIVVVLSLIALSACAGPLGASNGAGANAVVPVASRVHPNAQAEITARKGGLPLPNIEITITHEEWPNGKLITKGTTNRQGRVRLSGDWTDQEWICAGGKYTERHHSEESSLCLRPFQRTLVLYFN
jgi:hypothetical protein